MGSETGHDGNNSPVGQKAPLSRWQKLRCWLRGQDLWHQPLPWLAGLLSKYMFSFITLAISVYVFAFVPQITNVWKQGPPIDAGAGWLFGYGFFIFALLWFYLGSGAGVLGRPLLLGTGEHTHAAPIRLQTKVWRGVRFLCLFPSATAAALLGFLTEPDAKPSCCLRFRCWTARFLAAPLTGPVLLFAGVVALFIGVASDSSLYYPLEGAFCRGLGLVLACIGLWLLSAHSAANKHPAPVLRSKGRWLFLVVAAVTLGIGALWNGWSGHPLIGIFWRVLGLILLGIGLYAFLEEWAPNRKERNWWAGGLIVSAILILWGLDGRVGYPHLAGLDRGAVALFMGLGFALLFRGLGVQQTTSPAMKAERRWFALFCRGIGARPAGESPLTAHWYVGRLLSWLLLTILVGEMLWRLASSSDSGVWSYRLYTIWAILQALTVLVLLGLLTDRLSALFVNRLVRQIAAIALVGFFWGFTRTQTISPDEFERHLSSPDQVARAREADKKASATVKDRQKSAADRTKIWFDRFESRIQDIPVKEGPVVLVAASGGGSRAAIFTALTLETLRRTPIDPNAAFITSEDGQSHVRTWADNIVVVSSVSGGSLATAYYVHRLKEFNADSEIVSAVGKAGGLPNPWQVGWMAKTMIEAPLRVGFEDAKPLGDLQNTTKAELISRLYRLADHELEDYPKRVVETVATKKDDNENQKKNKETKRRRLSELGVLIDDRAATAEELRTKFKDLVSKRDKLLEQQRMLQKQQRKAPAAPIKPNNPLDDFELDTLTQLIARIRSYIFIRHLKKPAEHKDEGDEKDWVLQSKIFDEMCLDFMAPLMRGTLSPTLDRGDALARFWTHRFGWYDATNFNGYKKPVDQSTYQHYHPLVCFNTCDVAYGSRLVIGFPPIPDDLWKREYEDRKATHARPKPLNELVPGFRVSLARAVRLSSNFPFGFRVSRMELPPGDDSDKPREWVHMLDGGVIDNTGIDTIYELFKALEWHADLRHKSDDQQHATTILESLRKRGVVILEIDAGAKPSKTTPSNWDLVGGVRGPLQALDNASYTNAEVVKQFYLKEIRRTLSFNLDQLKPLETELKVPLASFREIQSSTAMHMVFECNHYLPGQEEQDQDVMTAWSLGPQDKAQIVQRFLIELEMWDQHRRDACTELRDNLNSIAEKVERPALVKLIQALSQSYDDLALDVRIGKDAMAINERRKTLRDQLAFLETEVKRVGDANVTIAWKALQDKSSRTEKDLFAGAMLPDVQKVANKVLNVYDDVRILMVEKEVKESAAAAKIPSDPQVRYDAFIRQGKAVLAAPPPK